jgi:hypothetical protein
MTRLQETGSDTEGERLRELCSIFKSVQSVPSEVITDKSGDATIISESTIELSENEISKRKQALIDSYDFETEFAEELKSVKNGLEKSHAQGERILEKTEKLESELAEVKRAVKETWESPAARDALTKALGETLGTLFESGQLTPFKLNAADQTRDFSTPAPSATSKKRRPTSYAQGNASSRPPLSVLRRSRVHPRSPSPADRSALTCRLSPIGRCQEEGRCQEARGENHLLSRFVE